DAAHLAHHFGRRPTLFLVYYDDSVHVKILPVGQALACRNGYARPQLTHPPRGPPRTGNTVAPSCSMASDTRDFAPRSTRKKTHPPPPAPQTLAPTPPAGPVTSTS